MWIVFALSSALTRAVSQLLRKQAIQMVSPQLTTLLLRVLALPIVLLFGGIFSEFILPTESSFWAIILIAGTIETGATIASFASLKADNLSRVAPIQSFIPVFLVILTFSWSQELPPALGIVGVCIVTIGAYLLKLERGQQPLDPFKRIIADSGSRLMLIYAFLSAIVILLEKESLSYTNPTTSLALIYAVQIVLLMPYILLTTSRSTRFSINGNSHLFMKFIVAIAAVTALSHLLQFYAVDATFASFAFAVQRVDLLMMVVLSSIVLREHIPKKLYVAGALCSLGVILVSL